MIAPSGTDAPVRESRPRPKRVLLLESLVLLSAAPFLAMPEVYPPLTLAALLVLGAVWVFSILSAKEPASPLDILFALWSAVLIIGILVTADPNETLSKATNLILGLAVWRYLALAVRARRSLEFAVGGFLFLGMTFSLVGIAGAVELPKIPALTAFNPFYDRPVSGLGGLTIHPNQLAGLICLYWPLLISLTFAPPAGRRSWRWRILLAGMALTATLILLLTQSRGGWIGAAAGLFGLALMWGLLLPRSGARRGLRLALAGWVLALLLVLGWVGPGRWQEMWQNPPQETAVGTLVTLNYRKQLWPWALTAIQDFPFTGVGLGAFRHVAFRLYPLPMAPDQDIGHAHNIFLQTALDIGLPGLTVYLALLIVAGVMGWRVARRDAELRSVSLGLLAGLIAVHVFGLADTLALGSRPGILFWYSLGLLTAMNGMVSVSDRRG